jgi:undecaprenyl diphosphate synthase
MEVVVPADPPYSNEELTQLGLRRDRLPRHVAAIMDGNGRWAKRQGLPRIEGHRRGVQTVRAVIEECARLKVGQLTLYCFSSENWKRPPLELDLLMGLLKRYVIAERTEIMRQEIRFSTIGRTDRISPAIWREVEATVEISKNNPGMRLCLALDYGARDELTHAVKSIAQKVRDGQIAPEAIDESTISNHLYTAGMIDPDLVIRTAGEMRVSNFLLWQISYAELWVTQHCWPEFTREDLYQSFRDFAARERRFGGLVESSESQAG